MFYKFLSVAADFIPLAIAVAGIIMSYKQPQKESHLKTTLVLLAVGFVGTGILSWARVHNESMHDAEVETLKHLIQTGQDKFDKAEIIHAGEIKYLQGEVTVFSQFAPAVIRLAQATELNTRKTYEAKMLSNKDLYDATMEVVRKLRDFNHKRKAQLEQQMLQQRTAMGNAKTNDDKNRVWEEQNRALTATFYQNDAEFRNSILPDAVYVRNELLKRKIQEPPPPPFSSKADMDFFFTGSLAGTYPELSAADYLEQMAKQLTLK